LSLTWRLGSLGGFSETGRELVTYLFGFIVLPLPPTALRDDSARGHQADYAGQTNNLPLGHASYDNGMPTKRSLPSDGVSLADALDHARTGDIWLFRGRSMADKVIRLTTNAPVNHVAMAVVLDDLPPLLWHAEASGSLPDVWVGGHQRGAQLHRMVDAVDRWTGKYEQDAYTRQLDARVTRHMEDELLGVIDQYDGRNFPSTVALARHWVAGRARYEASQHAVYCAELVAISFQRMGLMSKKRPANYYDPGKFWSGDRLDLENGATLTPEIAVEMAEA
jgi:hypothetical protein